MAPLPSMLKPPPTRILPSGCSAGEWTLPSAPESNMIDRSIGSSRAMWLCGLPPTVVNAADRLAVGLLHHDPNLFVRVRIEAVHAPAVHGALRARRPSADQHERKGRDGDRKMARHQDLPVHTACRGPGLRGDAVR